MDLGSHIQWGIGAGVSIALWQEYMYESKLPENIDAFRELLQDYAKLPPEEVDSHLYQIVSYDQRSNPRLVSRQANTTPRPRISRRRAICTSYLVSMVTDSRESEIGHGKSAGTRASAVGVLRASTLPSTTPGIN